MLLEQSWTLSIVAPTPRLEWKRLACYLAYRACLHARCFEPFVDQTCCSVPRSRLDAALVRQIKEMILEINDH